MSRPDLDLGLDVRDLRLYRIIGPEYIRGISGIKYVIENYDNKAKYEAKNKSCEKIRRYLIIDFEEYNIQ